MRDQVVDPCLKSSLTTRIIKLFAGQFGFSGSLSRKTSRLDGDEPNIEDLTRDFNPRHVDHWVHRVKALNA